MASLFLGVWQVRNHDGCVLSVAIADCPPEHNISLDIEFSHSALYILLLFLSSDGHSLGWLQASFPEICRPNIRY